MTRTVDWLRAAWQLVLSSNFGAFAILMLLYSVCYLFINQVALLAVGMPRAEPMTQPQSLQQLFDQLAQQFPRPVLIKSYVASLVILGPLMAVVTAAVYAVVLHFLDTGEINLAKLGVGFQQMGQVLPAGFLIGIFTAIASFFCLIPYFLVKALYLFPLLLIVDRKLGAWAALEASRRAVQRSWLGFTGFVLVTAGIVILGAIPCGMGLIIAYPVVWCATAFAYRELWPRPEPGIMSEPPSGIS